MRNTNELELAVGRQGYRRFVTLLRPRQWAKNGLVFAAPLFAARLNDGGAMRRTLLAFIAFCLVSSAAYIYNDVRDAADDRLHPLKSGRPIASGAVTRAEAYILGAGVLLLALFFAALSSPLVLLAVVAYAVLMVAYCDWGRRQPPLDVFFIAAGFLLRAIAGAAAGRVPASPWFLALTILLALMLGFGKRRAELALLGEDAAETRPSLKTYNAGMLDQLLSILAASLIVLYAIYAVGISRRLDSGDMIMTWPLVVLGVIRYIQISHTSTRPPDELLVSDRVILGTVLAYAVVAGVILEFHTHLIQPVSF
ncbi:MAG: UbiA family prenyltransferase [Candidatus Dormibacteria bacterium]